MTELIEEAYAARSTLGGSPFPPIADYGFLSDCEVSALVAPVLLVGPWRHGSARSETHQRAPLDHSAERVLLRTVRCLQGSVDFVLECEPAFDYGRQRGTWRYTGDGYGEAGALAGAEREPDQGLWEVRGPAQHFTASKVLCWVAADRGAKLALLRGDEEHAATWRKAADEIRADVCAHGTDDRGVFCQYYGTTALEASALLIPLVGFLPPEDERVRASVLAIADELTENELVLRYRVEETDDGFSGEEGSFTICSFWLVSALTEIGTSRKPSPTWRSSTRSST